MGCIGKSDIGQAAVVAALNSEDFYAPVSMELYMSEDWEKDEVRRTKTKIPDWIKHRTKIEMALEIILKLYKKIKPHALGYNPEKSTTIDMAKAHAQRVFVERVFEEGKFIITSRLLPPLYLYMRP